MLQSFCWVIELEILFFLLNIQLMSIVYIFANPSFPDFIKIGRCEDVGQRLKSLSSNSALPLPFECVFACNVNDPKVVEQTLHKAFDQQRVNPRREFFRMSPEPVIALLQLVSQGEVTVPSVADDDSQENDRLFLEKLYGEFTFDQASVELGSRIIFSHDDFINCVVIGRNEVELNGSPCSLTEATKMALKKVGKDPKIKLSPARYWLYNGELLAHRKHQKIHGRID